MHPVIASPTAHRQLIALYGELCKGYMIVTRSQPQQQYGMLEDKGENIQSQLNER